MAANKYYLLTNVNATLIWIEHSDVLIWVRQTIPLHLIFVGYAPVDSEVSDFRVPITTKEFTSKKHFRGKAFVSHTWIAQLVSIVVILIRGRFVVFFVCFFFLFLFSVEGKKLSELHIC